MITETVQAAAKCAEGCHYATHMRGGVPIHVRICTLCKQIDFDDLTAKAQAYAAPLSALPEELQGDGPCEDCGTAHNIRWFTESVFWNEVVRRPNDGHCGILCIPCFVKRVDVAGLWPRAWRLMPEWHWETKQERDERRAAA